VKVGDLVKHFADPEDCGIVLDISEYEYETYPYLVQWLGGDRDWFDPSALEVISESR